MLYNVLDESTVLMLRIHDLSNLDRNRLSNSCFTSLFPRAAKWPFDEFVVSKMDMDPHKGSINYNNSDKVTAIEGRRKRTLRQGSSSSLRLIGHKILQFFDIRMSLIMLVPLGKTFVIVRHQLTEINTAVAYIIVNVLNDVKFLYNPNLSVPFTNDTKRSVLSHIKAMTLMD